MISIEEKLLKERIQHLLAFKKVSVASISDSESERVMLGRQIKGENTIVSFRTIYKLLYMFPDVDANWLILGEGQMTKTIDRPQIFNQQQYQMQTGENNSGVINFSENSVPVPVQMLLNEKDKRIADLEANNKQLQGLLSVFTRQAEAVAPKKKIKNSDAD